MIAGGTDGTDRGFTLIELLVVLTLGALLTVVLVGGFQVTFQTWRAVQAHIDAETAWTARRGFLAGLLSQTYPLQRPGDDGKPVLDFDGTARRIDFLAPLPASFGAAAIVRYRLTFTPSGDLVLGYRFDQAGDDAPFYDMTIGQGFVRPQFQYFGAPDAHSPAVWQPAWSRPDRLPDLINIHFGRPGPGPGDMTIAPVTTAIFCENGTAVSCAPSP